MVFEDINPLVPGVVPDSPEHLLTVHKFTILSREDFCVLLSPTIRDSLFWPLLAEISTVVGPCGGES